jgi:hypothetical protein
MSSTVSPNDSRNPAPSAALASTYSDAIDAQLAQAKWLVNTLDQRRASLENRAAITVSASALIFGGVVFVFGQFYAVLSRLSFDWRIFFAVCVLTALALLICAIIGSAMAIANIFKTSERMNGKKMPSRLFFYPRETFARFADFDAYVSGFSETSNGEFLNATLGELWVIGREYHQRYSSLRMALRCLLAASLLIFVTMSAFVFRLLV